MPKWGDFFKNPVKAVAKTVSNVVKDPLGEIKNAVSTGGLPLALAGSLLIPGVGSAITGGLSSALGGVGSALGLGGTAAGAAGGIGGLGGIGGSLLAPALATGSAATPGFLSTLLASPSLATGALSLGSGALGNVLTGLAGTTALGGSPTTGLLGGLLGGGAGGAAGGAAGGLGALGGSFLGNAFPYVGAAPNMLGSTSLGTLGTLTNSIFGGGGQTVDAIAKGAGQLLGLGGGGTGILGGLGGLGGQVTGMGGQQGGILSGLLGGGGLGGLSAQDLLIGGGSLASSIYGANVAEKAAQSQREAIDNAIASLREGQGTARGDIATGAQEAAGFLGQQPAEIQAAQQAAAGYLDPFYQAGTAGLGQLQQLAMGQGVPQFLANNPAYQFRQQEAQKALERSAAARGGLLSGQFAKALQERSQGLASEEFGNAFNRLAGVVGMGQQAGQQLSSLRERTGERMLTNIGAQAGLRQQAGTQRAGIGQQFAGSLADLMRSRGDAVATGQIGQANAYNQGLANLTQYVTAPKYRFAGVGA
jgi:hypothetical protein